MTENGKIKKAKDTTQEYFFLKTLLYTALFDGLVLYIIGFEGIYNHAGWFIGVSVFVLAFLGLYAKSIEELKEERKIPEDEELFGMKSFTLLLIALSMIGMVFYIKNDEQYNKQVGYKIFEVFNYSNNDKTVTIDNKTYTLHPKTHKRITLQKEKVKVDDKEYKENGWYLVNISGDNICYEIKQLYLFSSLVATMPKPYETSSDTSGVIRTKVYRHTKGRFLVFPNESFSATSDTKDKYYGISIVPCS